MRCRSKRAKSGLGRESCRRMSARSETHRLIGSRQVALGQSKVRGSNLAELLELQSNHRDESLDISKLNSRHSFFSCHDLLRLWCHQFFSQSQLCPTEFYRGLEFQSSLLYLPRLHDTIHIYHSTSCSSPNSITHPANGGAPQIPVGFPPPPFDSLHFTFSLHASAEDAGVQGRCCDWVDSRVQKAERSREGEMDLEASSILILVAGTLRELPVRSDRGC
ncbi:hypothetical protein BV25DRAFT_1638216 [Artomyces pyxidatus]|uniref:Uncharacterized protein n=1 Tax=Artomyces pyxidatus TaxID=48021 RepID=A0ACB8SIP7_9AGAM|nr:hypothetical protein BV25DRAFT_1638216 [Artomyces pyxidatus]